MTSMIYLVWKLIYNMFNQRSCCSNFLDRFDIKAGKDWQSSALERKGNLYAKYTMIILLQMLVVTHETCSSQLTLALICINKD